MGFHLYDLWAIPIGLGFILFLVNAKDIYESILPYIRRVYGRYLVMSISSDKESSINVDDQKPTILPVKRNGEIAVSVIAIEETLGSDPFQFPSTFIALARLVLAGKVGETEALRLAVGVSPGKSERYREARRRLHQAIEQEQPSKYKLTTDQELLREELGLPKV